MSLKVTRAGEYPVSCWAGGKTTQLCIYPPESEYAKRNFIFRISSATVECERSEFTVLPQVERIIMPLEGNLELSFGGYGQAFLRPFEQARFDGGWNTTSIGKAADFNLMLREGAKGDLKVITLNPGEVLSIHCRQKEITVLFAVRGSCGQGLLETGSLLMMEGTEQLTLENDRSEVCRLICARIVLPC